MQTFTLILLEWRKWAPRPVTWIPLASVTVLLLMYAVYQRVVGAPLDYSFIARATTGALGIPALLAALVFPAAIMAYEWQHGTIRSIRVRPVRRMPLLMAKGGFAFAYGLAILIATTTITWVAAYLDGHANGVTYGGSLLFTSTEMQVYYVAAAGLYLLQLSAVTAFSLAMSAVFRTTGAAITATLVGWLVLDIVKYPLHIETYVVFTYWDAVWVPFVERTNGWEPMAESIAIPCAVAVGWWLVSMLIAYGALRRSEG